MKMKTLVFLVSLFLCGSAIQQDLTGRMFTFPQQSDNSYIRLYPQVEKIFFSISVCLRFSTDQPNCIFSLATPGYDNGFLIGLRVNDVSLWVGNSHVIFKGKRVELNKWHSLCATWDSGTGLVQMWLDGTASVRKSLHAGGSLHSPLIILGQDQDHYGGGFVAAESFSGQVTDVHMWDYVLSPCEIHSYMQAGSFRPGTVLDWSRLEYSRHGYVVLELQQTINACRSASGRSSEISSEGLWETNGIPELAEDNEEVLDHSQTNEIS